MSHILNEGDVDSLTGVKAGTAMRRISVSGAQEKFPANEHLTMQIASQVYGILTADNGLCFTGKGQPVYITRRFDVKSDLGKSEMEDFASLVGRNEQTKTLTAHSFLNEKMKRTYLRIVSERIARFNR